MELKVVDLSKVKSEDRFREDMGDIASLVESFKKEGIIQPLAVRDNGDGTYRLLAGGRRHTAATKAELPTVPVRIYPQTISDLEMLSIELMENVCRKDMTYMETCNLRRKIHQIQVQLHGEKTSSSDTEGASKRSTAQLLGVNAGNFVTDIKLSEMAEIFPELGQQKNRAEAIKLMDKMSENLVRSELAKRVQEKDAKTPLDKIHKDLIS